MVFVMRKILMSIALLVFFVSVSVNAVAQQSGQSNETLVVIPPVSLQDANGKIQPLTTLIDNRTAVVNFVFTTCNSICPLLNATMQAIEARVQERLGKEVVLISISVDPLNDTPEQLKTASEKLGAGENWYWLTGKRSDVNQVLKAFGIPTGGRPEDHPPVILVGNAKHQKWLRWVGIPAPDALVKAIDRMNSAAL